MPAEDASAADWLLAADVDWWDLVRWGPPGFEACLRVPFASAAELAADRAAIGGGELPGLRRALEALARWTATPERAYAGVWDGWCGGPAPGAASRAPLVRVPERTMLLLAGPVGELRDAPALAWGLDPATCFAEPHLVWPEDRAWCLACDVDEEVEFTVGCSGAAAEALLSLLPGARRSAYGAPAPLLRDH